MIGLWIALAGGAGAVTRFLVDGAVSFRRTTTFPWATLAINVSGSFVLGLLAGGLTASSSARQIVGVGFCGGYTTFSTASMETVRLAQRGRWTAAVAFAVGGLVASVGAAALGWELTGS